MEKDVKKEGEEPDRGKARVRKKWSIEVCNCFFHLWGLEGLFEGHWRYEHTHTLSHTASIQVLIFSLKHIHTNFIHCFIFTDCLASHCGQNKPTKLITHLCSLHPGGSGRTSPPLSLCPLFYVLCTWVCVCAISCLLNIIGISTGGLIKKQLPLVAVGDAWRRVAPLIWWTVWGTLSVQHTHKHADKLCSLQKLKEDNTNC